MALYGTDNESKNTNICTQKNSSGDDWGESKLSPRVDRGSAFCFCDRGVLITAHSHGGARQRGHQGQTVAWWPGPCKASAASCCSACSFKTIKWWSGWHTFMGLFKPNLFQNTQVTHAMLYRHSIFTEGLRLCSLEVYFWTDLSFYGSTDLKDDIWSFSAKMTICTMSLCLQGSLYVQIRTPRTVTVKSLLLATSSSICWFHRTRK